MKVFFGQVYIDQGAEFPFTHIFQRYVSAEVTALVESSAKFIAKYGEDFKLIFNVSSKHALEDNEIRGPSVFRKTKDVEYTVFLPFTVIMKQPDPRRAALRYLFDGAYVVFGKLGIESARVRENEEAMINRICSDPEMFESEAEYLACRARNGPDVGPPLWTATPPEG